MKRSIAVIASLSILGTGTALAQYSGDWAELIRTRDITGGPVYTTNEAYDDNSWGAGTNTDNGTAGNPTSSYRWGWSGYSNVDDGWEQIGEIEDIVLDNSGQMIGIVAEVGGFLDIGDKHVLLQVQDLDLVPVDDTKYAFITRFSQDQLEEMESVDEGWWD